MKFMATGKIVSSLRSRLGVRRVDLGLLLTLAVLALLPALPYLLRGQTLVKIVNDPDNTGEGMLYRKFIGDSLSQGHFPLWSPHFYCGFPFIGWSHASIFSPVGLVFLPMDYPMGAVVSFFLSVAVFTVSTYLLCRVFAISPLGSLMGALVSGLLYFSLTESGHFIPRLYTTSWLPLFIALLVLFIRKGKMAYLLGAALAFGFQLFSGHIDTISRELLLLAMAAAAIFLFYRAPAWLRGPALIRALAVFILGFLIAAIQVVPLFELVAFSIRSQVTSTATYESTASPLNYMFSLFTLLIKGSGKYWTKSGWWRGHSCPRTRQLCGGRPTRVSGSTFLLSNLPCSH